MLFVPQSGLVMSQDLVHPHVTVWVHHSRDACLMAQQQPLDMWQHNGPSAFPLYNLEMLLSRRIWWNSLEITTVLESLWLQYFGRTDPFKYVLPKQGFVCFATRKTRNRNECPECLVIVGTLEFLLELFCQVFIWQCNVRMNVDGYPGYYYFKVPWVQVCQKWSMLTRERVRVNCIVWAAVPPSII